MPMQANGDEDAADYLHPSSPSGPGRSGGCLGGQQHAVDRTTVVTLPVRIEKGAAAQRRVVPA